MKLKIVFCEIGDNEKCKSWSNEINKCSCCHEGFLLKVGICDEKNYYNYIKK